MGKKPAQRGHYAPESACSFLAKSGRVEVGVIARLLPETGHKSVLYGCSF